MSNSAFLHLFMLYEHRGTVIGLAQPESTAGKEFSSKKGETIAGYFHVATPICEAA